jgi:hypothetical protein
VVFGIDGQRQKARKQIVANMFRKILQNLLEYPRAICCRLSARSENCRAKKTYIKEEGERKTNVRDVQVAWKKDEKNKKKEEPLIRRRQR